MPKNGFRSITISEKLLKYFDDVRKLEPFKDRPAFLADLLDSYVKYRCPECGAEIAVIDKHHKC